MTHPPPAHAAFARRAPVIGLALGSGSARGWAHFGVLRALTDCGIRPGVVCGASIGALVGAAHVLGLTERFERWVLGLRRRDVVSFMDISTGGGLLKGEKLMRFFRSQFTDRDFDALETPFAAVATALHTGEEVWLRQGSVVDAVRASIAMPGLFTPVWHQGRLLVDGGLVNPVPVSLARALGADIVIAVDLNADLIGRHLRHGPAQAAVPASEPSIGWLQNLQRSLGWHRDEAAAQDATPPIPPVLEVLTSGIHIMQVRITRSRMSGDPPEFTIAPRLSHLSLLDFHRAHHAIEAGEQAAQESLGLLRELGLCPPTRETTPAAPPDAASGATG